MRRVMIVVGVFAVLVGLVASAPSCTVVITELTPCLSYLKGQGEPSRQCCTGVKGIASQSETKEDKQAVCECLKQGLSKVGSYDSNKVHLLPGKCGVSLDFPPMTPSTDCSAMKELKLF